MCEDGIFGLLKYISFHGTTKVLVYCVFYVLIDISLIKFIVCQDFLNFKMYNEKG